MSNIWFEIPIQYQTYCMKNGQLQQEGEFCQEGYLDVRHLPKANDSGLGMVQKGKVVVVVLSLIYIYIYIY